MSFSNKFSKIGPGLIYAGAAVGVSHLVQSTRAGALFGFELLWAIILANLIKYPFFEFASRYTAATGESLLHGYRALGKWALLTYFLMTLSTMLIIQSAVTIVTAGLAEQMFGIHLGPQYWSLILLIVCAILLAWGKYKLLDKVMKFIVILLTIATLVSVLGALGISHPSKSEAYFLWNNKVHLFFLVALIGWMPAPIDVSVWSSIWSVEKNSDLGERLTLKEALFDFKIGYIGTIVLALLFLSLGALVMYSSGQTFSAGAVGFAGQLISLYTKALGSWSYPFIAVAAFTTMFSTTLTCLDAFPRVLGNNLFHLTEKESFMNKKHYFGWISLVAVGTLIILFLFVKDMKSMIDFATTVAFVTSPVFALINYLAIRKLGKDNPFQISKFMNIYSLLCIILLSLFTSYFLFIKYLA